MNRVFLPYKSYSKAKIGERTFAVSFDENIAAFDVSMSDGWFASRAKDFGMKMSDAGSDGEANGE